MTYDCDHCLLHSLLASSTFMCGICVQVHVQSAYMYDAAIWWAMAMNRTLREAGANLNDIDFGRKVIRNLRQITFEG